MMRGKIETAAAFSEMGLAKGGYAVVTLHRPSNVDQAETLKPLAAMLTTLARRLPVVFPIHPRTRASLEKFRLLDDLKTAPGMHCTAPVNYVRFMNLVFNCRLVVTDSGGIQEETTYLGIPCLTLRENTERPVTITQGTNRLCRIDTADAAIEEALDADNARQLPPDMWDGHAAHRVADHIEALMQMRRTSV
jgi:UDP-N-acetylglucosamine 2-epimerase (non-hydrolysing)